MVLALAGCRTSSTRSSFRENLPWRNFARRNEPVEPPEIPWTRLPDTTRPPLGIRPHPDLPYSIEPGTRERSWRYIVLHHSASSAGTVESIDREHRQRLDGNGNHWLGVGYHFVIGNGSGMPDGQVEPTFRWREQIQGAHAGSQNREYNEVGIGICLIGHFDDQRPTPHQLQSARRLIADLRRRYSISASDIILHKDIRTTECPGRNLRLWDLLDSSSASLAPPL